MKYPSVLTIPLLMGCSLTGVRAQEKPNILVILADDLGYSDLGCYGGEIKTPNLDRLAENGIRFSRFYNASRSCPTRASLLTGLYQHQAGIGRMTFNEGLPGYLGTISRNAVTIPEVLKTAGYRTSMVGKWHVAETPLREDQRDWLNHQVWHDTFTDLCNYPVNRGFDTHYGTIYGVVDYFDPFSLVEGEVPITEIPENYYITDALSDRAASEILNSDNRPFFMYLSYTAPHWPLHALPEDIEKYKDTYTVGWDSIRDNRYERMKKLGIFGDLDDFLTERQFNDSWKENPTAEWDARAMAVHAAMVDRMDQGIGKVIDALKKSGKFDNTLILFMSDNGCSAEECQKMIPGKNDRPDMTRDGRPIEYVRNKEKLPGPETTYAALGPQWANVANTPFRYWKAKAYEGGICTPCIAHWPKWIKLKGGTISDSLCHVMDIMATCVDIAGAEYPKNFKGHNVIPAEGKSMLPILYGKVSDRHKFLGFEHFNESSLISSDGWKIVRPAKSEAWELYNLNTDRTEKFNVAEIYPEKVEELEKIYYVWAEKCMVYPNPDRR